MYQESSNGRLSYDSFIELSAAEECVAYMNDSLSYKNVRLVRDVGEADSPPIDYKVLYQQLYDDFVRPNAPNPVIEDLEYNTVGVGSVIIMDDA